MSEYWRSGAGLSNITPQGKQWPEGEGFGTFLVGLIGDASVLEFGCGVGRLAGLFAPERYTGIDICPEAIERAQSAHPAHRFTLDGELPAADVTLLHTVLLHVPDGELGKLISRLSSPRVLVSEILGRHWRRSGDPPVFNREAEEYGAVFAPSYRLVSTETRPYPHYRDTDLTVLEFQC